MNTLRLYAALYCFVALLQPALAQQGASASDTPPTLDVKALCAESPSLCALAQNVQLLQNAQQAGMQAAIGPNPSCYTTSGRANCTWPPDCGFGYVRYGNDCVPIIVSPYRDLPAYVEASELISRWPYWWVKPPWDIPRPPYPYPWWLNSPLPDPWQKAAPSLDMTAVSRTQVALPVAIGTDKGVEAIPDFCLRAEWESGNIPPACSGLAGLVRKLGLKPEDAPLLQTTP